MVQCKNYAHSHSVDRGRYLPDPRRRTMTGLRTATDEAPYDLSNIT
jgi:hypothetical protein